MTLWLSLLYFWKNGKKCTIMHVERFFRFFLIWKNFTTCTSTFVSTLCDFMIPFLAFLQSVEFAIIKSSDYHRIGFHLIVPKCNFSQLVLLGIIEDYVVFKITPYYWWAIIAIADESCSQMTQNIFLFWQLLEKVPQFPNIFWNIFR